jgi:hypothetical protein
MFVEFLRNRPGRWSDSRYLHPNIGGRATLASYGLPETGSARALHDKAQDAVPEEDRDVSRRPAPQPPRRRLPLRACRASSRACRWRIRTRPT